MTSEWESVTNVRNGEGSDEEEENELGKTTWKCQYCLLKLKDVAFLCMQ